MRKRIIYADKRYLLLPIANMVGWFPPADKIQYLSIYRDGILTEEYELVLDREPRCWSCLYLERYQGETLEISLEGGDESLIDLLEISDTLKDADTLYREPMRPLVHFTPMHGFMNDPNGLFYHAGEYHYFAQLNPYGLGVGNTHWMHATSRDLVHWKELPYALLPDESGRMYSGGGVVDVLNTSGLGCDGQPPIFLFYTAAGSKSRWSRGRYFEVGAAVSTDGGKTFEKRPENPIVPHIAFMNRDPKVVWEPEGKNWVMMLYLDDDRYLFLYSADLLHWDTGETVSIRGSAECPDLFCLPLDGNRSRMKWVLWGSTDHYMVGYFAGRHFVAETDTVEGPSHRLHSAYTLMAHSPGNYAAQTFTGVPGDRVIQMSWIRTWVQQGPFSSCATLPNELRLVSTADGPRLSVCPVQEVEQLTQARFSFQNCGLEEIERIPGQYLGEAMDMTFRFGVKPGRLIAVSVRGVLIVYDPQSDRLLLPCGAYRLGLEKDVLDLRVVTDRCSVEIYANDGRFNLALATVLDPSDISVRPVDLDAGIAVDFEIRKLGNMWQNEHS